MLLPVKIQVGSVPITIKRVKEIKGDSEAVGLYDWERATVLIKEGLEPSVEDVVIAHELVHVFEEAFRTLRYIPENLVWVIADLANILHHLKRESHRERSQNNH